MVILVSFFSKKKISMLMSVECKVAYSSITHIHMIKQRTIKE